MEDTIRLKHTNAYLTEERLGEVDANVKAGTRNPTWTLNAKKSARLPGITIVKTPDGIFHVYVECSIPTFLYGHNARLPKTEAEVLLGIEEICSYVRSRLDIQFDPTTASISKIHLARDYLIGDAANNAVFSLIDKQIRYFPLRNITSRNDEASTLYFNYPSKRRNCVICIYPKYADVAAKNGPPEALDASRGILRIEYRGNTLYGVRSICKRFGVVDAKELLTKAVNDRVFEWLESELCFPECIQNRDSPLSKLLSIYDDKKAQRLFGFHEMRKLKGDAEMTKTQNERRKFNESRRECEKAGVWLDHRKAEE